MSIEDADPELRILMEIARQSGVYIRPLYERLIMREISWEEFRRTVVDSLSPRYVQAAQAILDVAEARFTPGRKKEGGKTGPGPGSGSSSSPGPDPGQDPGQA